MGYLLDYMKNYLSLLFPVDFEEGECIRLCFLKQIENGTKPIVKYVNNFEEAYKLVLRYRSSYHCYVSLATYKNEQPYKRHVLFLDYDQKDFPDFKGAQDYTAYLKSKMPTLYNHMIVLSGSGGCHFYIGCEEGDYIEVAKLNKRMGIITNADLKACSITQIARIPGSYNLKKEKFSVKILSRETNVGRYSLDQLDRLLKRHEEANAKKCISTIPQKTEAVDISQFRSPYYCVNNMLANGVQKGERNFALGRITACLKKEMYTYEKSKEMVFKWNTRCDPPKEVSEVERDFKAYWFDSKYKLLGCSIPDKHKYEILKRYCNPELCKQAKSYKDSNAAQSMIFINSSFFDKKLIKELSACQYAMLLSIVALRGQWTGYKDIRRDFSKLFSEKTVKKALDGLTEKKLITILYGFLSLKNVNSKYNKDISIHKFVLVSFLKYGVPSCAEFKVYLALRYLTQMKKPVTFDALAEYLGISKSTVAEHIKALEKEQIIFIEKRPTDKGLFYNYYLYPKFTKSYYKNFSKFKAELPAETTSLDESTENQV